MAQKAALTSWNSTWFIITKPLLVFSWHIESHSSHINIYLSKKEKKKESDTNAKYLITNITAGLLLCSSQSSSSSSIQSHCHGS